MGRSSHSGSVATTCFNQPITINDANNVSAQWHRLTHHITGCVSVCNFMTQSAQSELRVMPKFIMSMLYSVAGCECERLEKNCSVSPALPKVLTAADYQHKPQLQLYNVSADQTWRWLTERRKKEFSLSVWRNQVLVAVWTGESIEMLTNLSLLHRLQDAWCHIHSALMAFNCAVSMSQWSHFSRI